MYGPTLLPCGCCDVPLTLLLPVPPLIRPPVTYGVIKRPGIGRSNWNATANRPLLIPPAIVKSASLTIRSDADPELRMAELLRKYDMTAMHSKASSCFFTLTCPATVALCAKHHVASHSVCFLLIMSFAAPGPPLSDVSKIALLPPNYLKAWQINASCRL